MSPLLPHTQKSLCMEQIAKANTKTERKDIQTKFRDRVKALEDAKAAEEEKEKKKGS